MTNKEPQDIYGRCYCHSIRFLISNDAVPVMSGYCHCLDCRQAHAAPVYQYVYVNKQNFQVFKGLDLLSWYTRSETRRKHFKRYFCTNCGTKVYNQLNTKRNGSYLNLCGTFPSLFDDQNFATSDIWSPKKHVYCAEAIMDLSKIDDELPRCEN